MQDDVKLVNADKLREYCSRLFQKAGVPKDEAYINADCLVEADLAGVESHGVTRMGIYLKRLRVGATNPALEVKTVLDAPGTAVIDACNSMGAVASKYAMEVAIAKAKKVGVSFVSVRNSNHNGMAAYYTKMALAHNMIGYSATNSASRTAPWGSRAALLGTNPFSWSIPAGKELPIIADMASCVVARGKIQLAQKKNKSIPLGWALTRDGEETTDPTAALSGCVLPFGGPKGSGIATITEVLTGILAGSAFSTHIRDMYADFDGPIFLSHYFGAIDVSVFGPAAEFKAKVDELVNIIRTSPKAKGVEEIFLPGEIEARTRRERLEKGIPLNKLTLDDLRREGEACDVPFALT
jgi:LDH2 family malate/lactate/ureidoglycolate dehydrogenase